VRYRRERVGRRAAPTPAADNGREQQEVAMNSSRRQRPTWVSPELFPLASRFLDIDGNTVHYVNEGTGPVLLTWADKDMAFRDQELRRFQTIFPHVTTANMHGAGHFVADDAPTDMITALRDWTPIRQR
jgi:pimeloyl-ACP methyl ester carboxylesterase